VKSHGNAEENRDQGLPIHQGSLPRIAYSECLDRCKRFWQEQPRLLFQDAERDDGGTVAGIHRQNRARTIAPAFRSKVTPQIEASLEFKEGDVLDTYAMRLFHAANDTLLFADETLDYKKEDWQGPHKPPMSLGGCPRINPN
jgi:hypothetical protein